MESGQRRVSLFEDGLVDYIGEQTWSVQDMLLIFSSLLIADGKVVFWLLLAYFYLFGTWGCWVEILVDGGSGNRTASLVLIICLLIFISLGFSVTNEVFEVIFTLEERALRTKFLHKESK